MTDKPAGGHITGATKEKIKNKFETIMYDKGADGIFLAIVITLLLIGVASVFSASHVDALNSQSDSYFYIFSQAQYALLGIGAMIAIIKFVNYNFLQWVQKYTPVFFGAMLILNAATRFLGTKTNGAYRWIDLPGLPKFQPSEFLKLAVIMMFAYYITKFMLKKPKPNWISGVLAMFAASVSAVLAVYLFITGNKAGVAVFGLVFIALLLTNPLRLWVGGPVAIIAFTLLCMVMQKHLSGLIIFALIGFVMMIIGETPAWFFIFPAAGGAALWNLIKNHTGEVIKFLNDIGFAHAGNRLEMWGNPFSDPLGKGYQMVQSLYAISWGGSTGLGWGGSRQKHLFLPEPHNDFIFSIFSEEQGFLGALLIFALFAALVWRGIYIASKAPDKYSSLLVLGIVMKIAIQVLLNIAVVTDALPATGIPLPFFSYGGTAIIVLLVEMGIILSISKYTHDNKELREF